MENDILDVGFGTGTVSEPRFANFGNRLGAALLDFLCTLPIFGTVMYFTIFAPSWNNYLLAMIVAMLYKPVMEGQFGATLGKMILKLRVVQHGGEKITWAQAFTRYIPWLIGNVLALWAAHDVFMFPGMEDVTSFTEYIEITQEYQMENGFSMKSIISSIAGWLPLVSALFLLGSDRKQALHDRLAETYVVHTEPAPTY